MQVSRSLTAAGGGGDAERPNDGKHVGAQEQALAAPHAGLVPRLHGTAMYDAPEAKATFIAQRSHTATDSAWATPINRALDFHPTREI